MNLYSKNALIFTAALTCFGCSSSNNNNDDDANATPAQPALGAQIDRAGRPVIATALMETFNGDETVKNAGKDSYNIAAQSDWPNFADNFEGSLAIMDSLDTVCGNQLLADDANVEGRYQTLASILSDDQIYVRSTSDICGVYLGLEAEVVGALGAGEGLCGGRTPADDVIERSYSVLATNALTGIDDTIVGDDCVQDTNFPFLCDPE